MTTCDCEILQGRLQKHFCNVEFTKLRIKGETLTILVGCSLSLAQQEEIKNFIKASFAGLVVQFLFNSVHKPHNLGRVIVVGSGKGGVGKSAITAQFAHYLSLTGVKVGVIDADVCSPALCRMLGIKATLVTAEGERIIPVRRGCILLMSLSFWLKKNNMAVWSTSTACSLIYQFVYQVDWSGADIILIDLPAGVYEVQALIFQIVEISQVLLLSAPQKVAQEGAARFVQMASAFGLPIAGYILNMAHRTITESRRVRVAGSPLHKIGEVMWDPQLSLACDNGKRYEKIDWIFAKILQI